MENTPRRTSKGLLPLRFVRWAPPSFTCSTLPRPAATHTPSAPSHLPPLGSGAAARPPLPLLRVAQVRQRCGLRLYVPPEKLGVLSCLGMGEEEVADTFTTDPRATPVHVVPWGTLGETWPFFRPNFVNMEKIREQHGARQVLRAGGSGGWGQDGSGSLPQGVCVGRG